MTDTENPNTLPLEMLPEGYDIYCLSRISSKSWICELEGNDSKFAEAFGTTPRAAILAAIKKIKGEG